MAEAVVGGAVINYRANARQLISETKRAERSLKGFSKDERTGCKKPKSRRYRYRRRGRRIRNLCGTNPLARFHS